MKNLIKKNLRLFTRDIVFSLLKGKKKKDLFNEWIKNGCSVPPPHFVKQNTIREYQKKYGYKTLIETGTYLGDMVDAPQKQFKTIISIE